MKSLIIAVVILVSFNLMAATSVLLKTRLVVGFAPEEYRGVFTTSILSNGNVEYTDNKGKVIQIMKLSKSALKNLVAEIKEFKVGVLEGENGPVCMDAPSTEHIVVKDGQEIIIKDEFGCNEKVMYSAIQLVNIIESANMIASYLK